MAALAVLLTLTARRSRAPLAPTTIGSGTAWTQDFSSGEALRGNFDRTVTQSPCHLQHAYQGVDPSASGDDNHLPWRIGLATQTNSTC